MGEDVEHLITRSKQHYVILDGLRGVAALAVVIFHFMEWVASDFSNNFIAHGFLAVDFFFCLSGFVVAYAYDDRIEGTGKVEFFKSRLIRLHPLVIFGSVLGIVGYFIDPFSNDGIPYEAGMMVLLFISSILLIPMPVMHDRAFNLFGLNAPSWSLFWEYVANVAYALVLHRLNQRFVLILLVASAFILCVTSYRAGNLLGGWAGENFWDGGARVFYSFVAGMVIYRFKLTIRNRFGFVILATLLSIAFMLPWNTSNWLTELLVVLFYFPLIVCLGVGSTLSTRLEKICHFSGEISYPLYMTHYWAIWIFGHYYTGTNPSSAKVVYVIIGGVIFLVAFAYLVLKFFDMPIRRYLNHKRNSLKD